MSGKSKKRVLDVAQELASLEEMTVKQLQAKWMSVFEQETRSRNKRYLKKKIAWRIQEIAEGGLSERVEKAIDELAPKAPIRRRQKSDEGPEPEPRMGGAKRVTKSARPRDPRLPEAGTILERTYKGATYRVKVLEEGFVFDGETYKSLSKVAREITGTSWNGFVFFGLNKRKANA